MDILKQTITQQGVILSNKTLQLDAILNHQVDPQLIMEVGKEFARRFREAGVTKVMTIESSGITVAFATALELGVPLVFARRKKRSRTAKYGLNECLPSRKESLRISSYPKTC